MNIKIGCDPELFVKDNNGNLLSGYNMIPGTKKEPFRVEKGAVQVDGMALEFNIDPAIDEAEFSANIVHVMGQMKAMIDHDLFIAPVAHFGHELIRSQPPEALDLGCDPDFNGWTKRPNEKPDVDAPFRTASGHVHVGWCDGHEDFYLAAAVACQLDFYLGLPSLLLDADTTRRELYGRAGAFRLKPYGMEYRVLSNFWLSEDDTRKWVFRTAKKAVTDMFERDIYLPQIVGDIQHIINESRIEEAKAIIKQFGLEAPNVR